jgi:type I restriction enzyme S subunit
MAGLIETRIGPLPKEWELVQLRDTCLDFFGGGTPSTKTPEFWDGNVAWTTSAHLDGLYLTTGQRRITEVGLEHSACRVVPAGNLLIGTRVGVGKTSVNLIDIAISQDLTGAIIDKERFLPEYLALYLQTACCQSVFALQKRGATIKGIPREDLHRIEIAAPPLPEQRAIAGILSKILSAVELQHRIVATLKELKAATMAKLFREGLLGEPLKQTEIGEIPKGWEILRLDQVATIERGKFAHRPRNDPRFYGGTIPFIQTGDVAKCNGRIRTYTQTLNDDGLAISRLFPRGTIVLTIAANIADTGILEFDSAFPDSLVGITPDDTMDTVFLQYYLRTQKTEMDRLAPKGTQKNINIQFLKPWPTPRPRIDEQREIAQNLRSFDDRLEVASAKHHTFKSLFSSMLHLLMTGRVRVTPKMIALQRVADRERQRKAYTGTVDEKLLKEIVKRIVEAVAPEKIILFGSAARGEMGPDSDLDLLIVKSDVHRLATAQMIEHSLTGITIPTDIVVATPKDIEVHKNTIGLIYRPALQEGKILYAA